MEIGIFQIIISIFAIFITVITSLMLFIMRSLTIEVKSANQNFIEHLNTKH